jgi:protein tyrosine phosphatase
MHNRHRCLAFVCTVDVAFFLVSPCTNSNAWKRTPLPLPRYDRNRIVVNNGTATGYINASLVGTLDTQLNECFITAQTPLPPTAVSFWSMVWEYDASCVVGLSDANELAVSVWLSTVSSDGAASAFPSQPGASVAHGDFVVVLKETTLPKGRRQPARHELTLIARGGQSRAITAFEFSHWPRDGVPTSSSELVDLVVAAEVVQRHAGGPMVVHSAGACGRAGCLIAVMEQTRMYSRTYRINPFASVVALRHARADAVRTPAQYVHVHEAIVRVIMRNTGL